MAVRLLVKYGADLNGRTKQTYGWEETLLKMLIYIKRSQQSVCPCNFISDEIRVKMFYFLLDLGIDINHHNNGDSFRRHILYAIVDEFNHLGDILLKMGDYSAPPLVCCANVARC